MTFVYAVFLSLSEAMFLFVSKTTDGLIKIWMVNSEAGAKIGVAGGHRV